MTLFRLPIIPGNRRLFGENGDANKKSNLLEVTTKRELLEHSQQVLQWAQTPCPTDVDTQDLCCVVDIFRNYFVAEM